MKAGLKSVLGLLLVLSTSAWSQALCPMMLFSQTAEPCGMQQKASAPGQHPMAQHDCCPGARRATSSVEPANLSACSSGISCCAVERQPANAQKAAQTSPVMAVIGRVVPSELHISISAQLLGSTDPSPPTRDVLSFNSILLI